MENYLQKGTKFCIVPDDFDNTIFGNVVAFDNKVITFESDRDVILKTDEIIEAYSNCKNGIFYCKSKVLTCNNKFFQIQTPEEYEILQRRESERILIKEDITIIDNDERTLAKLIDLSVGGMKIVSDKELKINETYGVSLNFDNLNLNFEFKPLRISVDADKYEISGMINLKNSNDKIELVQFCYKKQFEASSRK